MRDQIHNWNPGPVVNLPPVVSWFKVPNSNEKILTMVSSINVPAIGAAYAIKSYKANESDEITLQVGDIISVIDMPDNNHWWRGKKVFEVGYFPSECVELINGSNILNPNDFLEFIKQNHTGSLRFKASNNENENPLVCLLKCKQLGDDENLASIHRLTSEQEANNDRENAVKRNDKKPLIECQTNAMNIKQHSTTPRTRTYHSISPLKQTDQHNTQNHTSNTSVHSICQTSTDDSTTPISNSVFKRRNRISSTLPKSLTSTLQHNKPLCVNLFNNRNLISTSFDTSEQSQSNSSNHQLPNCSINSNNSPNTQANASLMTNSQIMGNKRGKLSNFLRSIINRTNSTNESDKRTVLKRPDNSNVLINLKKNKKMLIKKTVFGCELNEYLNRTSRKIPLVLEKCCDFLEKNGVVHGVYRLSGVNSNIQKLIKCFNDDEAPDFNQEIFLHDIHCVSSLLKLYFRELPNPLLTFELYENFVKAIQPSYDSTGLSAAHQKELSDKNKLSNLINVLKMLPLNHYVSLEHLVKHLNRIASYSNQTGMTVKNLAIVWSPNLLRSKELEIQGGIGALQCIAIQAVLTEYLIRYADELFNEESRPFNYFENEKDVSNSSFQSANTYNQSNEFSTDDQSNESSNLWKKVESNQRPEKCQERNDSYLSKDRFDNAKNKFQNIQNNGLLDLDVAQKRMQRKCDSLENENKTLDELVSSNLKEENEDESNELFVEPCLLSFTSNVLAAGGRSEESKRAEDNHRQSPTFGVLGNFGSSRRRKRFGDLDLVDAEQDDSVDKVRKRLFECEDEECDESVEKFDALDRFKYKGFDEQSVDEQLSKSSIKREQTDEPLQRYHTILDPKTFHKNKTSTPKESTSSNLFKRTPNKWKPSIKL